MSRSAGDWLDRLIEYLVVPSFSSLGPAIRRRRYGWRPLDTFDLRGRTVVLTGGTSGIGATGARILAGLGPRLLIVGRNGEKTQNLVAELRRSCNNPAIEAVIADLGNRDDVQRAATEITTRCERIDVLMHNAGALFTERKRADNGTDLAVELMVATPFLLTGLLRESLLRAAPARVLTMSSGGMYTAPVSVDALQLPDSHYSGTRQYARAKRAQVVLNSLWAERVSKQRVVFHSLHPGWVDTPGINEALPGFSRVLAPLRLVRSAREGADTMIWLSAADDALRSSGEFWLDRSVRKQHRLTSTRESDTRERRERLWSWCERHTGWQFDPADWVQAETLSEPQSEVS